MGYFSVVVRGTRRRGAAAYYVAGAARPAAERSNEVLVVWQAPRNIVTQTATQTYTHTQEKHHSVTDNILAYDTTLSHTTLSRTPLVHKPHFSHQTVTYDSVTHTHSIGTHTHNFDQLCIIMYQNTHPPPLNNNRANNQLKDTVTKTTSHRQDCQGTTLQVLKHTPLVRQPPFAGYCEEFNICEN